MAKRRRCWCYWCNQRTLFPTLHFVLHVADVLLPEKPPRSVGAGLLGKDSPDA